MLSVFKKLAGKLHTLKELPATTRLLFIEALFTSAWVKMSLLFLPFHRIMGWLGTSTAESSRNQQEETLPLRREIKSALDLCRKYAPWRTECYTISLTGKLMLRRRRLSSTLYIGFKKDETGFFKGHAWLRANDLYICGFKESMGFTVNFIFS